MGSQTLEILRQGVWASLTGGYFYDPHQDVFCNVVHLYLWLYLVCSPFVAYMYFPSTWLTWCMYCASTSFVILLVKLMNMALHRLYDRAQTMSEANLKNQFFKVTKETESKDDDTGIEMKVICVDGSRTSVEQVINEASEENSMLSIENVNSIIDLKVDVHRKNSSESIELMFYAPSMLSGSSQQDQQSLAGSASVSKSIPSASASASANVPPNIDSLNKYFCVYPGRGDMNAGVFNSDTSGSDACGTNSVSQSFNARQLHLARKCSEIFGRRHQRCRLERQSSLDATAEALGAKLMRNQSDTIPTVCNAGLSTGGQSSIVPGSSITQRNDTFLHSQAYTQINLVPCTVSTSTTTTTSTLYVQTTSAATSSCANSRPYVFTASNLSESGGGTSPKAGIGSGIIKFNTSNGTTDSSSMCNNMKTSRLQRHRSSETHDERLKHQNRGLFLSMHGHEPHHLHLHHPTSGASSIGALAVIGGINNTEDIELGLGGSSSGVCESTRGRPLQSWILDSSSEMYLEDDSYTKSDMGIEQFEARTSLQQQQKQINSQYQHAQQFRLPHHHLHHLGGVSSILKDPTSTMSALQLSVVAPTTGCSKSGTSAGSSGSNLGAGNSKTSGATKRRRHSNATAFLKSSSQTSKSAMLITNQTTGVRRIKSAALEISCAQHSVSNLTQHPNSIEAISGQQQHRNPLPPPSQCLVRNQHLNLYPRLIDQNFCDSSSTCSSSNFGTPSVCDSTAALIEPPVYPIVEHSDEKGSLDLTNDEMNIANINDNDDEKSTEEITNDVAYATRRGTSADVVSVMASLPAALAKRLTINEHATDMCNDDDDELDDVPIRRRHKALGCSQTHHSAESDVSGIQADEDYDVFKDFDGNLENLLCELHDAKKQLDDALMSNNDAATQAAKSNAIAHQNAAAHNEEMETVEDDDDETDNNGSRSPLLSVRNRQSVRELAVDIALHDEVVASQRGALTSAAAAAAGAPNHNHVIRSEADSGCPSSDCEQVSVSSKDQLLAGLDGMCTGNENQLVPRAYNENEQPSTSKTARKNMGAIPKVVKYHDSDDLCSSSSASAQLHRRRGGSARYKDEHSCSGIGPSTTPATYTHTHPDFALVSTKSNKVVASTHTSSSSNSSHSISAESLSADIHKMLWLMHGGTVDERGRPITGIALDGTPIPAHPNIVPPNMSCAHFQFYQDAIQALHSTYPSSSIEHLTQVERSCFRDKLCRDSKQILDLSVDFANQMDNAGPQVANNAAGGSGETVAGGNGNSTHPPLSTLMASSSALNSRNNVGNSSATAISLQGLINVIRNERNGRQRNIAAIDGLSHVDGIVGSSGPVGGTAVTSGETIGHVGNTSSTSRIGDSNVGVPIVNVDGHHFGPYCEYWRPACLLSAEKPVVPKSFYKYRFKCCGYDREFKISMDRLQLLALFDRDLHWLHVLLSFVLCTLVAYLGSRILQHDHYEDIFAFVFCVVIAGAQYSLVKSVQPDAASPIHGFNKTVAYSRAIYFSLCSGILLLFKQMQLDCEQEASSDMIFFGISYSPADLTQSMLQIMYIVMICLPIFFSLGLFPQINTFLMYMFEQIDMHVFGGNASSSLLGSFICVLRSILAIILLYGPLYVALFEHKGTQYILFSIFCAMLIPLAYHLSRSASDFSHIWRLIKTCIVSTYRDDDDEVSATSLTINSQKIATSTPKRSKTHIHAESQLRHKRSVVTTHSDEHIELSSLDKLPMRSEGGDAVSHMNIERKSTKSKASSLSSSQTLGKTISSSKKAITASSSYASIGGAEGGTTAATSEANDGDLLAEESETINDDEVAIVHDAYTTETTVDGTIVTIAGAGATIAAADNTKTPHTTSDNDYVFITKSSCGDPLTNETFRVTKAESNLQKDVVSDVQELTLNKQGRLTDEFIGPDDKISSSSTTNAGDISTITAGGATTTDGLQAGSAAGIHHNSSANHTTAECNETEMPDPLPRKLQNTVNTRLKNDFVVMILLAVGVLALHCSTVFTVLQPDLNIVLYAFTGAVGVLLHYVVPQMRKHMPWLCFARPILRQKEFGQFEVSNAPKVMWFEKVYIYLCMVERNVLFPLLAISALTADSQTIADKFGAAWGTLIVTVCGLKFVRNAYSDPTNQYLIVIFTVLLFRIDFAVASETFLIDYFFVSLAFRKCCDLLLKLQFIVTYIAPWQITWGSAFHAFAQPFSVPHSAMLFLQAVISALLSTPLNPFLGSAIFLTSYVRPIKFWERDYNTRRIDHSNTRLSSQLERDLGADDNNLNSIFYEHLTRSLQHSLCGDLLMGRWGNVNQGDCFVLASDYLNCLVHIIELGNGLCTFQMRGLEFRGTYCQQREVEAITEDVEDNDGCCCCDPGHLPRLLSANAMFSTRWLAWQVVAAQYVLEGYSISDNLASATLQVFEYRKVLITYYIKSIIYYVVKNPKLEQWLAPGPIQDALQHTLNRQFVDLDPIFNFNLDEDFDFRAVGITRSSFCHVYLKWINFCVDKRNEPLPPPQPMCNTKQNLVQQSTTMTTTPANLTTATVMETATTNVQPMTIASTTCTAIATGTGGGDIGSLQNTAATAYNDSKSTPNLSTNSTTTPQTKSQSQQQLRSGRPQKSATMSGSATVNNSSLSEHMASSHSFANISRQTSESAPGLSGAGLTYIPYTDNNSVLSQTALAMGVKMCKMPGKSARKDDSPRTEMHRPNDATTNKSATTAATAGAAAVQDETTAREKHTMKFKTNNVAKDGPLVSLCLSLGLLARRSLATASHSSLTGVEFFLHGLHALFKGDFRITSPRDEWVFADMELLHSVVAPAVKMALKLQQDHISNPDEFLDPHALYDAINSCSKELVISHEADPVWRSAVLRGAPNLLALRHVMEDGSDEYRIIRLTKRFLSFRVIKLNRECVRGLWAGQQQELIYLRNRNPERGSIQNAKQALRNIINSSCDQPIGYPIYVSPLTTSYADTNEQLCDVIGSAITLESIKAKVLEWSQRIRDRCRQGCSSGSAMEASNLGSGVGVSSVLGGGCSVGGGGTGSLSVVAGSVSVPTGGSVGSESGDLAPVFISAPLYNTLTVNNYFGVRSTNPMTNIGGSLGGTYVSDSLAVVRGGLAVMPVKPTSTTLIAGLLNREREQESVALREVTVGRHSSNTSGQRHSGQTSSHNSNCERRATLPIATGTCEMAETSTTTTKEHASNNVIINRNNGTGYTSGVSDGDLLNNYASSSCYAKMSTSSGNLGVGNIITTPGDYPRKTKGPICLTAATLASEALRNTSDMAPRKPRIEILKKVIIVDDTEIYDCLDLIDAVIWPSDYMRSHGGRISWKDWEPTAGMVGYVVHYWIPNHNDPLFRSHVNRIVYLVEIGDNYVPVEELGLREYHQIMGSAEEMENSRRNSIQRDYDEFSFYKLAGLTPMSASLENSTRAAKLPAHMLGGTKSKLSGYCVGSGNCGVKPKIQAVSSSSSDDEDNMLGTGPEVVDMTKFNTLINIWRIIADKKKNENAVDEEQLADVDESEALDEDKDLPKTLQEFNEPKKSTTKREAGEVATESIQISAIATSDTTKTASAINKENLVMPTLSTATAIKIEIETETETETTATNSINEMLPTVNIPKIFELKPVEPAVVDDDDDDTDENKDKNKGTNEKHVKKNVIAIELEVNVNAADHNNEDDVIDNKENDEYKSATNTPQSPQPPVILCRSESIPDLNPVLDTVPNSIANSNDTTTNTNCTPASTTTIEI